MTAPGTFAVDASFADVVRGSAIAVGRVRAVQPPRSGSAAVILEPPLPLRGGTVTLDPSAEVWGTAALEIAAEWPDDGRYTGTGPAATFPAGAGTAEPGTSTWPALVTDPLSPFTRELFVEAGLEYGNGQRVYVGLGFFRIYSPEQPDAGAGGAISVTAYDRSAFLRDSRLPTPVAFGPGTSVAAVFAALVGPGSYPWLPATVFDYDAAADVITARVAERERLDFLVELATSRGKVFYFDSTGTPRVRSVPDPGAGGWIFDVDAGPGGVLAGWGRTQTRDQVYSGVLAEGEQTADAAPPRALAIDDNPASPTYWDGDFGRIPRFFSSSFIETAAQAASAAGGLLPRWSGAPYTLDLSLAPNVALRPYDVVRVFPRGQGDPFDYEVHQLERLSIPLTAGEAMTSTTRQKWAFPRVPADTAGGTEPPPPPPPGGPLLSSPGLLTSTTLLTQG